MHIVRYCLLGCLLLSTSVGHAQWAKLANVPLSADAGFAFSIGQKVYYGGGFAVTKGFWEYDPVANKWTSKANIPVAKLYRCFGVSFSIGSKGYVAFGQSDSSNGGQPSVTADLWEYDPAQNTWTQKADCPGGARDGAMAFVINGKAYIGGGVDSAYAYLGDFYSYDPAKDEWTSLNDLPSGPIGFPMTFAVGGKGYMVAGGQGAEQTKAWSYDPTNDTWSAIAAFPGTAREAGVGFSIDTLGYAGLGEANYTKSFSDLYSYDPTMNTWTKVTPSFPYTLGVGWPVAAVAGNIAYLGTGADQNFSFKNYWYRYSPVPLPAVTLSQPADNAIISDTAIDFAWQPVAGATSYHFEIGQTSDFSGQLFELHETTPSAHVPTLLPGTFYWRVAATASTNDGPWSEVRSFSEFEASVANQFDHDPPIAYPNPVRSKLFVSTVGNLILYDMLGRELTSAKNATSIDVWNLQPGSYHYSLITSTGVTAGHFVKQ